MIQRLLNTENRLCVELYKLISDGSLIDILDNSSEDDVKELIEAVRKTYLSTEEMRSFSKEVLFNEYIPTNGIYDAFQSAGIESNLYEIGKKYIIGLLDVDEYIEDSHLLMSEYQTLSMVMYKIVNHKLSIPVVIDDACFTIWDDKDSDIDIDWKPFEDEIASMLNDKTISIYRVRKFRTLYCKYIGITTNTMDYFRPLLSYERKYYKRKGGWGGYRHGKRTTND
jgi:hypothetical protein